MTNFLWGGGGGKRSTKSESPGTFMIKFGIILLCFFSLSRGQTVVFLVYTIEVVPLIFELVIVQLQMHMLINRQFADGYKFKSAASNMIS